MKNIPKFQNPFQPLGLSQDNTTITQPINHSNMIRRVQEHEKYLREKHPNSKLSYGELAQLDRDINSKQQPVITNPPTRFETEQMKQNRLAYQQKVKENQENEITPEQYGQALGALEFMGYATIPFDLYGLGQVVKQPLIQGTKTLIKKSASRFTPQGIRIGNYAYKPDMNVMYSGLPLSIKRTPIWDDLFQETLNKTKFTNPNGTEGIFKYRRATNSDDRFIAGIELTKRMENMPQFANYQAHGMAKGTDRDQFARLRTILRYGTNPNKNFYTGPVGKIDPRISANLGTASGHAYSDGPFMLLMDGVKDTTKPGAFSHVLINDGMSDEALELATKYKTILQKEFPNIKTMLYSEMK